MTVTMQIVKYHGLDGDYEHEELSGFGDTQDEAIQDAWREYSAEEIANCKILSKFFLN